MLPHYPCLLKGSSQQSLFIDMFIYKRNGNMDLLRKSLQVVKFSSAPALQNYHFIFNNTGCPVLTTKSKARKYRVCPKPYLLPPTMSILGSVNTEKIVLWSVAWNKRKIKLPHVILNVHRWDLANVMSCNFPGERREWEGRGSHPSWATATKCHSSSHSVVYYSRNTSVSHITPTWGYSIMPPQATWLIQT